MENWKYFGVFLSPSEKEHVLNILAPYINHVEGGKIYCDHMTIIFNDKSDIAKAWAASTEKHLGEEVELTAYQIGESDKIIAIKVKGGLTANDIPHITILCKPGGKPVESNYITDWKDIEPFSIKGKIEYR